MNTQITQIPKSRMAELISAMDGGKLSAAEVEAFNHCVSMSTMIWEGVYNDRLVCVWGLIPPTLMSDRAYLWLHTTEAAQEHVFVLVRRSQIEVAKMLEEYPIIVGHCESHAERSIRWLRWLGAKFGEPEGKMIPFIIRGKE